MDTASIPGRRCLSSRFPAPEPAHSVPLRSPLGLQQTDTVTSGGPRTLGAPHLLQASHLWSSSSHGLVPRHGGDSEGQAAAAVLGLSRRVRCGPSTRRGPPASASPDRAASPVFRRRLKGRRGRGGASWWKPREGAGGLGELEALTRVEVLRMTGRGAHLAFSGWS